MASFAEIPPGAIRKENGDVVYPGTRRPDGTMRKERTVRMKDDGQFFIPQEEQGKFETKASRAAAMRSSGLGLPPGMAPTDAAASGSAKSKNARKNEARKARKAAGENSTEGNPDPEPTTVTEATDAIAALKLPGGSGGDDGDGGGEGGEADTAKRIKALKKKIKAIEKLEASIPLHRPYSCMHSHLYCHRTSRCDASDDPSNITMAPLVTSCDLL